MGRPCQPVGGLGRRPGGRGEKALLVGSGPSVGVEEGTGDVLRSPSEESEATPLTPCSLSKRKP